MDIQSTVKETPEGGSAGGGGNASSPAARGTAGGAAMGAARESFGIAPQGSMHGMHPAPPIAQLSPRPLDKPRSSLPDRKRYDADVPIL